MVYLIESPAPFLASIAAIQQPQGEKRGRPPRNPAELSNYPRSKRQQESQHRLEGEKREAERLKRNDHVARLHAYKAVKKPNKWQEALAEQRLALEQKGEDNVVRTRYVYSL